MRCWPHVTVDLPRNSVNIYYESLTHYVINGIPGILNKKAILLAVIPSLNLKIISKFTSRYAIRALNFTNRSHRPLITFTDVTKDIKLKQIYGLTAESVTTTRLMSVHIKTKEKDAFLVRLLEIQHLSVLSEVRNPSTRLKPPPLHRSRPLAETIKFM